MEHVPLHVCVHSFTLDEQIMLQRLSPQCCVQTCASQLIVITAEPSPSSDWAHSRTVDEQFMSHVLWKQRWTHLSPWHFILAIEKRSVFCVQFFTPAKQFKWNLPFSPLCSHVSAVDEHVISLKKLFLQLLHSWLHDLAAQCMAWPVFGIIATWLQLETSALQTILPQSATKHCWVHWLDVQVEELQLILLHVW